MILIEQTAQPLPDLYDKEIRLQYGECLEIQRTDGLWGTLKVLAVRFTRTVEPNANLGN